MVTAPDKTPATEAERQAAEMQVEPTPPIEDVAAAEGTPPPTAEAADEGEAAPPPETTRQRVARRFAERRQAEIEGNPIPIDEPPHEPVSVEAAPPPVAAPAPEPTAPDPIQRLKVDGREIELPLSEVIRLAQTNSAIEARGRALAEINLEINRARQERDTLRTAPAPATPGQRQPSETSPPPAPRETTNLDEAQLRDIAERITSGTIEEQVQALRELAEASQPPPQEPVDVDGRIAAAFKARDIQSDVQGMVQEFAAAYPDIATDPDLRDMAYGRTVSGMLADLEGAGVTPPDLARLRRAQPEHIANAHRAFREAVNPDGTRSFPNVRHYTDVLKSAGDSVMAKFGRTAAPPPAPQPQPKPNGLAARTDLKRTLTPTPRANETRAAPADPAPAGGAPNAKAAVARIAALRNRGRGVVAH